MKTYLDYNGLVYLFTKIKSLLTGKVDTTTMVNGHTLSEDVVISKEDVGLGNVDDAAQVKRSEMGTPMGVPTLNIAGVIPSEQLPKTTKVLTLEHDDTILLVNGAFVELDDYDYGIELLVNGVYDTKGLSYVSDGKLRLRIDSEDFDIKDSDILTILYKRITI